MKSPYLTAILLLLNIVLAVALAMHRPPASAAIEARASAPPPEEPAPTDPPARPVDIPLTEFAKVYSSNPRQFVLNLRAIGCPEETIKDILVAEVSRFYASQEAALRPTPADHVPNHWSASTSEAKLISRRQESAAIAREKMSTLQTALGYEMALPIPDYALTSSDRAFEDLVNAFPSDKRSAAKAIQERYWADVQNLRAQTHGFWLPEEVAALEQFKADRAAALEALQR